MSICLEPCEVDCALPGRGIFSQLSTGQIELLHSRSKSLRFERQQVLYRAHEDLDRVLWIRSGLAKLCSHVDLERTQTFAILTPGRLLGTESVFHRKPVLDAVGVLPGQCCCFEARDLRAVISASPGFSLALMDHMQRAMEETFRKIACLSHYTTEKRVISFLCNLCCERVNGTCQISKPTVDTGLSQEEIAEVLGVSRVSVNNVFSQLRRKGFIEYRGKTVRLLESIRLFDSLYGVDGRTS